ncbi:hypothetical protein [Nocardia wallacei]|uniref:hypothetical protein n=1 Tax=Nocardia wallacei TaxID=480035 RepID=UPI0024571147|nr:hypothetical protein [Nocardia wallacei]
MSTTAYNGRDIAIARTAPDAAVGNGLASSAPRADRPEPTRASGTAASRADRAEPSRSGGAAVRRAGLVRRLSARLESHGFTFRGGALSATARRELLIRGLPGSATVLGVRPRRTEPGHRFWVRVQAEGQHPYETRVRQRVSEADLELMQPGDVVGCRIDPGDRDRVVLYVPSSEEATRVSIAKILADGRRADATVLAATPVAADYSGRDDPVLRLDLELRAWDEPRPWWVRIVQPVPLSAIQLVDLGRHLEVAFFTVDRGESVAVDWEASSEV